MGWPILGTTIDGEAAGDYFGYSVSLSSDGTIVAVGAYGDDYAGTESGSVSVFQYTNNDWSQLGTTIDGDAAGDNFGTSVSLSSDGTIVAVGADYDDYAGTNSGSVSVFQYTNNDWSQLGTTIDGEAEYDLLGSSVSLSSDGTILAIGAYGDDGDDDAGAENGSVSIFQYTNNDWSQLGTTIDGDAAGDNSGTSVSLSSDGTIVAIGANGDDYAGTDSGSVSVFQYTNNDWSQLGTTIDGDAAGDNSGTSVSLSSDGTILAIGASGDDYAGTDSGSVSIFQYTNNDWSQLGSTIDGEAAGDYSGYSVSLSSDGTILAIGAYGNDENGDDSGHASIFKYTNNDWYQLGSDIDGDAAGDNFGASVSLSSNGTIVAVGADLDDYAGTDSGSVSIFSSEFTDVAEVNSSYVADAKGFSSITGSAPVTVTSYEIGKETTLNSIKDYDGNLHAGDTLDATASSYKYQGMLDVNGDGVFETIFTNKSSKRWVTAKVDSITGQIDFDDNGAGGGTRVVGIYADPLIAEGENNGGYLSDGVTPAPANFGVSDADRYVVVNGETIDRLALNSQVRFQNDLKIDNLTVKHSGDYDSDGIHEVYWKTNDGTAYLRSLMHADGNIRYANYQSERQMVKYLTANGDDSVITDITS